MKRTLKFLPEGQKPKFHKTIPMSNFDLLEWAQYLKIPLKNVLSRDQKVLQSRASLYEWFTLGSHLRSR